MNLARQKPIGLLLLFLIGIVWLVGSAPPRGHSGFLRVSQADGVQFELLMRESPSQSVCAVGLAAVVGTVQKICPQCRIDRRVCLSHLGGDLLSLRSGTSIPYFSLRSSGQDIRFWSENRRFAEVSCQTAASHSNGVCYEPNVARTDLKGARPPGVPAAGSVTAVFNWWALCIIFAASFFISWLILATKHWHGAWTFDNAPGVQRMHSGFVPRIGGLALLGAAGVGCYFISPADGQIGDIWRILFLCSLMVFGVGILEDITKSIGPLVRLLVVMVAVVLAWWFAGVGLVSVELPLMDVWLTNQWGVLLITMIAVAGVSNAINIVDGNHGLALGLVMLALISLIFVAIQVQDYSIALCMAIMFVASLGVFFWNYPGGRLFLGDGGAYWLGFMLGWIAILLTYRNPAVSPWACLLICAHPIVETLVSMSRRLIARRMIGGADHVHLHSLLFRQLGGIDRNKFHNSSRANVLVAPIILCFAAPFSLAAVFYYNQAVILKAATAAYLCCYLAFYFVLHQANQELNQKISRADIQT